MALAAGAASLCDIPHLLFFPRLLWPLPLLLPDEPPPPLGAAVLPHATQQSQLRQVSQWYPPLWYLKSLPQISQFPVLPSSFL